MSSQPHDRANPTRGRPGLRPRAYARFVGGALDGLIVSMPRELALGGVWACPGGEYRPEPAASGWTWRPS